MSSGRRASPWVDHGLRRSVQRLRIAQVALIVSDSLAAPADEPGVSDEILDGIQWLVRGDQLAQVLFVSWSALGHGLTPSSAVVVEERIRASSRLLGSLCEVPYGVNPRKPGIPPRQRRRRRGMAMTASLNGAGCEGKLEAPVGLEPTNHGFATARLSPVFRANLLYLAFS